MLRGPVYLSRKTGLRREDSGWMLKVVDSRMMMRLALAVVLQGVLQILRLAAAPGELQLLPESAHRRRRRRRLGRLEMRYEGGTNLSAYCTELIL